ncbi:hypothetical protein [Mangrovicoccus sp. HB161399]|uniref:hypothetical protein n=1 Tax=Mangrovicoccus sp. HB161399 TaxID=2720392 RepID=UPI0015550923|nr:hypothetical protein [Mangrovicoccus sp. HB161399]
MTEDRARANDTTLSGFSSRYPSRQDMQDKATEIKCMLDAADAMLFEGENMTKRALPLVTIAAAMARDLSNALDSVNEKPEGAA